MLIKFANADLLEAKVAHRGDTLLRTAHRATFNYEPREGFLYVRSRAISSRTNDNFDTWPADELRQAWATFIGKPVFVNHHNKDHRRARGVIIDAVLHEDTSPDGTPDTWVEVLMEVDAVRFPKLAKAILAGDIERTSMGADVGESECSYCGNVATTPDTYCVHVSRHKGQRLLRKNADGTQEDVLVHEICFPPSTPVRMADGSSVPIEMVHVGDQVLDHMGDPRRVQETMVREFDDSLVTIQVWGHHQPLRVTPNHPVLVLRRSDTANGQTRWMLGRLGSGRISPEFIPASEVAKGDFVVEVIGNPLSEIRKVVTAHWGETTPTPRDHAPQTSPDRFYTPDRAWGGRQHILRPCRACGVEMDLYPSEADRMYCSGECFGTHRQGNSVSSGYGHQLPDAIEMDSTFGRWCGWFLAEGSIRGPQVSFALHVNETNHAEEIDRLGNALFGLKAHHEVYGNGRRVSFFSANLARFMKCMGVGFYTKALPDEWLSAPIEFIGAVVDAHHDGDGEHGGGRTGGVQDEMVYQHATSSPRLADQLYFMHLRLGNTPTRKKPDPAGGKSKRTVPGHSIRARLDRTSKGRVKWGPWVFAVVHHVGEEPYTGTVHNLSVEGTHTYVVGDIAVHNCRKISFFENSLLVEAPADPTAYVVGVESGPGLPQPNRSNGRVAHSESLPDLPQGDLPTLRATAAYSDLLKESLDLDYLGLRQLRGRVPGSTGTAPLGHHVGGVRGVGAEPPVSGVVAPGRIAGVQDDHARRNRSNHVGVSPSVRSHAGTPGVRQAESSVSTVEEAASPWPAGVRPAAGIDLGQVSLHLGHGALESHDSDRTPADGGAFFLGVDDTGVRSMGMQMRTAAKDTPNFGRPGRGPKGNPWDTYTTRRVSGGHEVVDKESGEVLGLVWQGKDGWYGQLADGTRVVEGYPGSMGVAASAIAREHRDRTAAPSLDPDLCPASNQAIDNPQRRMRMACPACGKMLGGGRSPITKIPRHKPFVRGASKMATVEKTAWGEMKAPAVVNTLGLVECPVCGERNKFDGTGRCTVCGFLPPPEPFREPDLEVAQKVDMRDGWVNPELMSAPAFVPPEEGDDEADPVQKDTPPNQGAERTGGTRMRPSEAIAQRQAQQIQALRAENARLRAAQGGRQRRADVNNPGQPVPEPAAQSGVSTEETRSPDATADVTSGSAVLTDVGPATTTDVTSPGAAMTNVAPLATADVTAPVAGTTEMPPYDDTVIKVEPDASGGTDSAPAFSGDNSWVQARKAAQAHVFASIRLARLRIRAGIESGDDLVIAEKIASSTRPEIVRNEITTLDRVVRSAAQQPQRRPAPHVAQRTAPSLASMAVPGIQAVGGFAGLAVSQDEVGLFD